MPPGRNSTDVLFRVFYFISSLIFTIYFNFFFIFASSKAGVARRPIYPHSNLQRTARQLITCEGFLESHLKEAGVCA